MRVILNNNKSVSRLVSVESGANPEFIFKIDTSLGDGLPEFYFEPETSGTVDYTVFHDGNTTNITSSGGNTFTFNSGGIHQIKILTVSGITRYRFRNTTTNRPKLIDVLQWGNYLLTDLFGMFARCISLTSLTATDYPRLNGNGNNQTSCFLASNLVSLNCGNWIMNGTSMLQMFRQAASFNDSTINNMNITGVTTLYQCFWLATSFNQNLADWDVSLVTTGHECFLSSGLGDTNYRLILSGWTGWNGTTATKTLQNNVDFHFGNARYEIGGVSEDIRNYLINTKGWTITDGGGV